MVDFAKMLADRIAAMTPAERADYDARQAREAAFAATEVQIVGHFERLERRPRAVGGSVLAGLGKRQGAGEYDVVVDKAWEKPVTLRIETVGEGTESREVIRILGAVTGYESFTLTQDLVDQLMDPKETAARPRFYVCGGTAGRWDACWIEIEAVLDYLRERRPGFFGAAPAP